MHPYGREDLACERRWNCAGRLSDAPCLGSAAGGAARPGNAPAGRSPGSASRWPTDQAMPDIGPDAPARSRRVRRGPGRHPADTGRHGWLTGHRHGGPPGRPPLPRPPPPPPLAAPTRRQRAPRPAPPSQIQARPLAPAASHPSSGLKPADTEVLDHLPDPRVKRALRQLPADFRTAVYLADVEGYAYREIAGIMGTPIGTV